MCPMYLVTILHKDKEHARNPICDSYQLLFLLLCQQAH